MLLLLIADKHENRQAQIAGMAINRNDAVAALLAPYRMWKF